MQKYNLVIIGLGISGISLAKEASKNNINFLVLEKNKTFGGVWINAPYYSSLQTHKDYYGFNDNKIPNSYSNYPSKQEVLSYLKTIVNEYNILEKTLFNYYVESVKYDSKNLCWVINDKIATKFVGICSGYLTIPKTNICGKELKNFQGQIYHTKDFNKINIKNLQNKNLLIIGNGASACDVLNNLDKSNIKCNLTMIYKSDKYFIEKYIGKIPIGNFLNRFLLNFGKYAPLCLYRFIIICINYFYFNNYLPIPESKMNSKNLIASTIICQKVNSNNLVYIKDTIKDSYKNNVVLSDQVLRNIDTIILATGYITQFSFLEIQPNEKKYLQIFDKNLKNCAFIGFSPSYNWSKVSEKQSKLFVDYILGKFMVDDYSFEKYRLKHEKSQKINNLPFNDLTYELYNY